MASTEIPEYFASQGFAVGLKRSALVRGWPFLLDLLALPMHRPHKYYKWKQRGWDKANLCREPCFIWGIFPVEIKGHRVLLARRLYLRPRISFMKILSPSREALKRPGVMEREPSPLRSLSIN